MEKLYKVFIAILIVVFSFVKSNNSYAQNLVDNWSFEDTLICPTTLNQIHNAVGWEVCNGSPDYYNSCNQNVGPGPTNVSTPQNTVDYQVPKSGSGYAGLLTYSVFSPNVREFLGRPLNQVMQIGQKYFVSFYVARAFNDFPYEVNVAVNKIGVLFTTVSQTPPNTALPHNISQVYADSIIIDTLNWTQIKGSFIADSNYQYIGIGNYFDGPNTSFIQYDSNKVFSYYFFDDICVSPDSLYCDLLSGISQNNYSSHISIFPNPARDWIVVGGNGIKSLKIYDVSGREKNAFYQVIAPIKIDVSHLNSGIYIIQIETKNGYTFQKLIINH